MSGGGGALLALAFVVRAWAEPALTRAPELIQFVEAPFPPSETGRTGEVVLTLTLEVDGTVSEVEVTGSAGPAFDAAAAEAARRFVFTPAEVDGAPARVRIDYRYAFVERVELATTATYAGVVVDADRGTPVPGVTVTLPDGRVASTDADGRFTFFDVPAGPVAVRLEGSRLTALSTEETLQPGERLEATYEVSLTDPEAPGDDLEIWVSAPALRRAAVSSEVDAEQARKVPGTQGDVLRVVENLPGVGRSAVGTGALVVWGAAPEDTVVYVDGVPVPRMYHDGGLRSVVGPSFVSSVSLVPGGYGAAYGRGLGGLVAVTTPSFAGEPRGSVAADAYDASAAIGGAVGERWDLAVAGRYGYVEPVLAAVSPGVEEFFPLPAYHDGQARVGYAVGPGRRVDASWLGSGDRTDRTAPDADPAREASQTRSLAFDRVWVRYSAEAGDGTAGSITAFVGADRAAAVSRTGAVETAIRTDTQWFGARGAYRARVAEGVTAEAGLDAAVPVTQVTRDGSVAAPAREGDIQVFGQPPPDAVATDTFTVVAVDLAPYVELDLAVAQGRLHLVPGVRFDPYARSVSRAAPAAPGSPSNGRIAQDPRLEPRAAARWTASEGVELVGAWGRYGQQPLAADLSASFGNPALPIATGTHQVVGVAASPADPLTVEVTAYHTASRGLATRNPSDQPGRAEALVATGEGRARGLATMVRLDPIAGAYGWVSYTLGWSERRSGPDADWRPSDYDQRHVFTALGGFARSGWDLSTRARLASGSPRTEVVGAYWDARRDRYQPLFGEHNALRLPAFFQLDVRAAREWSFDRSTLELSLEVQNVTNRANVEEFLYNADYTRQGSIRGLPILPVVGVRWAF